MSYIHPSLFHTATTTGDSPVIPLPTAPIQFSAYLSAAGGSATIEIYVREIDTAPWYLRVTLTLSGVSDRDQFTIVDESWFQAKATTSAIAGGAVANIVMGG